MDSIINMFEFRFPVRAGIFLLSQLRRRAGRTVALGLTLALSACSFFYRPKPSIDLDSLPQARTQTDGPVRVTAAVLSPEQSTEVLGVSVYDSGIQPVWLSIENHDRLFPYANSLMNEYFLDNAIGTIIPPGGTISGFVYANAELGAKFAQVELVGPKGTKPRILHFLLTIPGVAAHYDPQRVNSLYKLEGIKSYDEAGFRQALEQLPCCTTNAEGTVDGDPLNIVFVGKMDDILSAFLDRQWNMTEELDLASSWQETKAFLFGTPFQYAPASPLYLEGRRQDVTIQKPRATINARNHVRLWRAPMQFEGKPVWVGQVSRDIGVRFTLDTWNLATHRIDPHVDGTRNYLVQDLFRSGRITKVGYVKGGPAATLASPRKNLTGDWYISDGLRAVLVISHNRLPDSEIEMLDWELLPSSLSSPDHQPVQKPQK